MKLVVFGLLLLSSSAALGFRALPQACQRGNGARLAARVAYPVACDSDSATAEAAAPAAAPVQQEGPGAGDFIKWYKGEKAREKYEEENKKDVVAAAMARLDGPLKTLAVLSCVARRS